MGKLQHDMGLSQIKFQTVIVITTLSPNPVDGYNAFSRDIFVLLASHPETPPPLTLLSDI